MFALAMLLVLFATASLPLWIHRLAKPLGITRLHSAPNWLPLAAGVLFFAAFFIPAIHIPGETDTFQQHFVGGGCYVALLYVYCKRMFGWRLNLLTSLVVLFAWASAFGVANELLEFALTKSQISSIDLTDADWDLLANTLGAFVAYAILIIAGIDRPIKEKG